MKNNIFKKVMTVMVLTTSLISGAAMADSPMFGENRDYQAAVVDYVPTPAVQTSQAVGYSESRDYQAVVVDTVPAAVSNGAQSHSYSENGNYTAAPAWTQN